MKYLKNILLLFVLVLVLFYGGITLSSTKEALTLWFEKLVPSMFVSLVLIRCIYHQHILDHLPIPILPALFKVDSATLSLILCMMFLGFPNGASFIDEAYEEGRITLAQAKRLLYTCSFAAPGFVILTCGALLFQSVQTGIALFIAQILSGLILLFCTRGVPIQQKTLPQTTSPPLMKTLSVSMLESGKALYMIGGYLMLFMSISGVLLHALPAKYALPLRILSEFSSGVMFLQKLPYSPAIRKILTSMLLSFGGLCVHMQVNSMAEHISYSYPVYFLFRIAQCLLSGIIFLMFLL